MFIYIECVYIECVCFRESRYLLFLTENYAALSILQQDLLFHAENPPFVLFGSSFPKDREYTQVQLLCVPYSGKFLNGFI